MFECLSYRGEVGVSGQYLHMYLSSLRWERRSVVSLVDELQGVKLIRMLHLADIMSWDAADCCYY